MPQNFPQKSSQKSSRNCSQILSPKTDLQMYHVPIIGTDAPAYQIEFCHINADAHAGTWKKDHVICLDNIKMNFFMKGEFSVVANERCYRPVYGDICILPPFQMHYGQILKPTHTDYYQLDIGIRALDHVTEGRELLQEIIQDAKENGVFLRPSKTNASNILLLCNKLETAIHDGRKPLAFAYVLEILSEISKCCDFRTPVSHFVLSRLTTNTINFIEANYDKELKIEELSKAFLVSPSYLSRLFRKEVGLGIHEYLRKYRVLQASYLLSKHSVSEVSYMCGFSDCSHFISVFKSFFDCTPGEYKKRTME